MEEKEKKKSILTEEKWRVDPRWYRKAFALRLLFMLVEPTKSKRLARMLGHLVAGLIPYWTSKDPWPPGIVGMPKIPGLQEAYSIVPPMFVTPFSPGPPHRPTPTPPSPEEIILLDSWYIGVSGYSPMGDNYNRIGVAWKYELSQKSTITSIKIYIGSFSAVSDNVYMEIRYEGEDGKPGGRIPNGRSEEIAGNTLPWWEAPYSTTEFTLPDKPEIEANTKFHIGVRRKDEDIRSNYYAIGSRSRSGYFKYNLDDMYQWHEIGSNMILFYMYGWQG